MIAVNQIARVCLPAFQHGNGESGGSAPLGMKDDIRMLAEKAMAAQTVNVCRDGKGSSQKDAPSLP